MSAPPRSPVPPWPLALLPLMVAAGLRGLWAPDEPRYAEVARAMWASGDFLVPQLCGDPYPDKPPGALWLWAAIGAATGFEPLALRLPGIAATAAIAGLVADLAKRAAFGRDAVRLAPLLWLTMALPLASGSRLQFDPLLALCTTAGLWAGVAWRGWRAALAVGVAAGIGGLVKGPVAWLWIGGVGLGWWWLDGRPRLTAARLALGAALAVAPVTIWAALAITAAPELSAALAFDAHLGRVFAARSHPGPPWEPLVEFALLTLPWTPYVALGAADAWRGSDPALRRAALWVAIPLIAFALIAEKRDLYLLPAYPAAALLATRALLARPRPTPALRRIATALAAAVLLATLGLAALPLCSRRLAAEGLAVDALPIAAPVAAALVLPFAIAALQAARRGATLDWAARFGAAWIALALALASVALPALEPRKSAAATARALAAVPDLPPTIVCIGVQPESFRFHAGLPTVADHGSGARLDAALARDGDRALALATERGLGWLTVTQRAAWRVVDRHRIGGREVLVLRPAVPAGRASAESRR